MAGAKANVKGRRASTRTLSGVSRRTARLMKLLESKPGATANPMSAPRAATPNVMIYKVMGKMFAILSLRGMENVILKCDPSLAQALREQYAGVGHRSHLDRRNWISVSLDADVPKNEIEHLVGHSYQLVCDGLTRKQRAELASHATRRSSSSEAVHE